MNPTVSVTVEIWCDLATDIWNAKITFGETRNGAQYGGNLVNHLQSKPGASHKRFLQAIRSEVKRDIDIFWT